MPELLKANPGLLACLRMCCCPPIARERLIGLAQVNYGLVGTASEARNRNRLELPFGNYQLLNITAYGGVIFGKDGYFSNLLHRHRFSGNGFAIQDLAFNVYDIC